MNIKSYFWYLFSLFLIVGCSPGKSMKLSDYIENRDLSSQNNSIGSVTSASTTTSINNDGIVFLKPDLNLSSWGTQLDIEIQVTPINTLSSLVLSLNNVIVQNFDRLPLTTNIKVDPNANELHLLAQVTDLNGNVLKKEIVLKKNIGNTTTPSSSSLNSGGDGTLDTNCMTNSSYDACIFWKNPVAQIQSPFSPSIVYGTDLSSVQTYGVKIKNTIGNKLDNGTIRIIPGELGGSSYATLLQGKTKYKDDSQTHYVAQFMMYYWLDYTETNILARTQLFYPSKKNIEVRTLMNEADNAFWDGTTLNIGYNKLSSGGRREVALGAEVVIHEFGHANFEFAMGAAGGVDPVSIHCPWSFDAKCCPSAQGCISGIHEGQADFLAFLIFPNNPVMGETFMNSIAGLSGRDPRTLNSITAQIGYKMKNGEVHDMGTVYSSILWTLYNSPLMDKSDFEKIYMRHLNKLTGSSDFCDAKNALVAEDTAHFGAKYKSIIQSTFLNKGLVCN